MTAATDATPRPPSVVTSLYLRTRELHTQAERTGIIRDILRGDAVRAGYVLLLRNLQPAYAALEAGLDQHTGSLPMLAAYRFARADAIAADLVALEGPGWDRALPLLAEGKAYAALIAQASSGDGSRLIAHAYTRYLGDLSGGLIMAKLLARSLSLSAAQLNFYDFTRFGDPGALKDAYRGALDAAGRAVDGADAIADEGAAAFEHNIALSCAVKDAVARPSAAE